MSTLTRVTRWQLLLAVVLAVGVVEFRLGISTPDLAKSFVEQAGYWLTGLVVVFFVVALVLELQGRWAGWGGLRALLGAHWPGLLVGLLGAVFWQVHEPHEFKVLFDEHVLAGTAYNMHFERTATYPSYAHFVNGRLYPLLPALDKRPLLYPFLVSVTHDLTGYRPENSFVVNGLLGFVLLGLVYAVGAVAGGWRVGCLGQLLLVGLPLLAQNATGGGYDLLNMTMLCALLLACWNYWRQAGAGGLNLMVLTGVMLANCRYESMLYLVALVVFVVLKWAQERNLTLTWAAALSPLLVTLPLLHNQVFMQGGGYFQTTADDFLNVIHVPQNAPYALYFLFSPDNEVDNSMMLSALGVIALFITFLGIGVRLPKQWREPRLDVVLWVLLVFVMAGVFVALCLFWGHWDDPEVARFSLPLQLAFAWCIMFVAAQMLRGRKLSGWVLAVVGVWAVVSSAPVSSRAFATKEEPSYLPFRWMRQYVLSHADPSVLLVARSTLMFTLYGQPSQAIARVNLAPEKVMEAQKLGLYREVWVAQELTINKRLNAWVPNKEARLDNRLILEPLAEFAYNPEYHIRISRVVGFDPKRPAGTMILMGEKAGQSESSHKLAWNNQDAGSAGPNFLLTERPAGEAPAVPTMTELPADPSELDVMMMQNLP